MTATARNLAPQLPPGFSARAPDDYGAAYVERGLWVLRVCATAEQVTLYTERYTGELELRRTEPGAIVDAYARARPAFVALAGDLDVPTTDELHAAVRWCRWKLEVNRG